MTATDQQLRALAFLAAAVRPAGRTWDQAGIVAALEKCRTRDLATLVCATMRAAVDPNVRTPAVIPTAGPHWSERLTEPGQPRMTGPWCSECGAAELGHTTEHPFTVRQPQPIDPDKRAEIRAQMRADMEANPGPKVVERAAEKTACATPGCVRGDHGGSPCDVRVDERGAA